MLARSLSPASACVLILAGWIATACKTSQDSKAASAPEVDGKIVPQSTPFPENFCADGGLQNFPTGVGWAFDPRMGCAIECPSVERMKAEFIDQLRNHRLYGDLDLLEKKDPKGARMARFYRERQAKSGLSTDFFAKLGPDKLFDGQEWLSENGGLQPGDLLLEMAFGTPNRAGAFYSKRGIAHAAFVISVDREDKSFMVLDSGDGIRRREAVPSQAIWVRPRAAYFSEEDRTSLAAWAEALRTNRYDNTLVDDIKEFHSDLHQRLDRGTSQRVALKEAFAQAQKQNYPPFSREKSFQFDPPSGLYCSEGPATIFSYMGFRQYGETPIELVTAFSGDGSLPEWGIYLNALEGFNADSGPALLMHKAFWNYFALFDKARKQGLVTIPGLAAAKSVSFAEAITANLKVVEKDGGKSDHIKKQMDDIIAALSQDPQQAKELTAAKMVVSGFDDIIKNLTKKSGRPVNLSQAAYATFMENPAYGPHTFLENTKYFDFKGVFYNTNMNYQARHAASIPDIDPDTGRREGEANISTTVYFVRPDKAPANHCRIGRSMPAIKGDTGGFRAPPSDPEGWSCEIPSDFELMQLAFDYKELLTIKMGDEKLQLTPAEKELIRRTMQRTARKSEKIDQEEALRRFTEAGDDDEGGSSLRYFIYESQPFAALEYWNGDSTGGAIFKMDAATGQIESIRAADAAPVAEIEDGSIECLDDTQRKKI